MKALKVLLLGTATTDIQTTQLIDGGSINQDKYIRLFMDLKSIK